MKKTKAHQLLHAILFITSKIYVSSHPILINQLSPFKKSEQTDFTRHEQSRKFRVEDSDYISPTESEKSPTDKNETLSNFKDEEGQHLSKVTNTSNDTLPVGSSSPSLLNLLLSSLLSSLFGLHAPLASSNPTSSYPSDQYNTQQPQIQVSALSLLLKMFLFSFALSRDFTSSGANKVYMPSPIQHYMFERINERYEVDSLALREALNPQSCRRQRSLQFWHKEKEYSPTVKSNQNKKSKRWWRKDDQKKIKTSIILELKTDNLTSNDIDDFRDRISFIIAQYHAIFQHGALSKTNKNRQNGKESHTTVHNKQKPSFEVILLLESPGGAVQDFGLLAAQLSRLHNVGNTISTEIADTNSFFNSSAMPFSSSLPSIQLTICVDSIAASGGYMIATQASTNSLYASPFAMIGSIGVISERINLSKLINKWGIKSLSFVSSEGKNPVGLLNDVTKEGQEIVQHGVDRVFDVFQEYVKVGRNMTDEQVKLVATGEIWLGSQALELGLVDQIKTSDQYILEKILDEDTVVLKLMKYEKPKVGLGIGKLSPLDFLFMQIKSRNEVWKNVEWKKHWKTALRVCSVMGMSNLVDFLCSQRKRNSRFI